MKILFYVKGIADACLAKALAQFLRQRLGETKFAAVAFRESAEGYYLRAQTDGLFAPILSETDTYYRVKQNGMGLNSSTLARLEETYGIPTIWQFVTHDRWLSMQRYGYLFKYGTNYDRQELLAHIQARFCAVEALFDEFKPDVVIYAGRDVGPSLALVLASVASVRGIPICVPKHTKIGSYLTISDTVFSQMPAIERRFTELVSGTPSPNRQQAITILETFREGGVQPSFMQQNKAAAKRPKLLSRQGIKNASVRVKNYYRKYRSNDPLYASWIKRKLDDIQIGLRRTRINRSQLFTRPVPGEKYVFFPLHLEPELALLLYAPFFTNQLAIIHNVAQSLPHDTALYIKEHPRAVGRRSLAYYQELAAIPNVRLIDSSVNSLQLIKNSSGVVTITGTAGLEAMLLGKPALTFGDVFYNFVGDLVRHTHSFEEVPHLIKQFSHFSANESQVIDFLSALLDESISVDVTKLATRLVSDPDGGIEKSNDFLKYGEFLLDRIHKARERAVVQQ
jgi:hypothetical protein